MAVATPIPDKIPKKINAGSMAMNTNITNMAMGINKTIIAICTGMLNSLNDFSYNMMYWQ